MSWRSRLFWIVSRVSRGLYSYFPVFGEVRGAIAVIKRDGGYVMIERNDGFGLGFPGGNAKFLEDPEENIRREVQEETGLTVRSLEYKFKFQHTKPFRTLTHVFEAVADGQLHGSWEGQPRVVSIEELQRRIIGQQRQIVDYVVSQK